MPVTSESSFSMTLVDYDGESTSFNVRVADLDALNFDAQDTLRTNFNASVNAITKGTIRRAGYQGNDIDSADAPNDVWAQREIKWLVRYHDTVTGDKFWVTIGTADTLYLNPNNKKVAHIGDAAVVDDFVAAWEAYVLSPDGNATAVDEIVLVGRNI